MIDDERVFFVCAASSLVWVGFVEQALQISLVASAYVRVRLTKADCGGLCSCR